MSIFDMLDRYAAGLTLLIVVGGLIWALATWRAEFDGVKQQLEQLRTDVSIQTATLNDSARDLAVMAGRQAERDQAGQTGQ